MTVRPALVLACLFSAALAIGQTRPTTVPSTRPAGPLTPQQQSANNLRSLMQGVMLYANDNRGGVPKDLNQMSEYVVRGDEAKRTALLTNPQRPERGTDAYVYVVPSVKRVQRIREPAKKLAIYEIADPFGDGANVAFWDGHVEFIREQARFRALVDEAQAAGTPATQPAKP